MEQPAQAQPSPTSSSFAGLLATFANPRSDRAQSAPTWNEGDLGEDVATLSYESALRAHARYRPTDRGDWATQAADSPSENGAAAPWAVASNARLGDHASRSARIGHDGDLRRASVTIRLSQLELEQLRLRAGEAGLTISAYLRSCTFEVEALRAQVKDALVEMRKAGTKEPRERGNKELRQRKRFRWIARLMAHGRSEPNAT